MEVALEAEVVQQRLEVADVLDRHRDVGPGVGAVAPAHRRGMIPVHPGMDRHDQAVLDAHPRHLPEHVPAELALVGRIRVCGQHALEETLRVCGLHRRRVRLDHAVVGGERAVRDEMAAALLQRIEVAVERRGSGTEEPQHPGREVRSGRVEVGVRAERRSHPSAQGTALAQPRVRGEIVQRIVGGGQHGDAELVEQRLRAEALSRQGRRDRVEGAIGGGRGELVLHAEPVAQRALEPEPRRGAGEQVPALGEEPPRRARVDRSADAEVGEVHAVGVQQPRHVMVRRDQQGGRIGESPVLGEHRGVDVPVRRDDRRGAHLREQLPRDPALDRIGGEQRVVDGVLSHGWSSFVPRNPIRDRPSWQPLAIPTSLASHP